MVGADLMDVEGAFFIRDGRVRAGFVVRWRRPDTGDGEVYRGDYGWSTAARFDADLRREGAFLANDLRRTPVRDATDGPTRAALLAGAPYPDHAGDRPGARG